MEGGPTPLPCLDDRLWSCCSFQDVVGPPLYLSDDRLEDVLEGYGKAISRVVDRLSTDNIVHSADDLS